MTRPWVDVAFSFFDLQLAHYDALPQEELDLQAIGERVAGRLASHGIVNPPGVPAAILVASDPARLAADWLRRLLGDIETSFFAGLTEPAERAEVEEYLEKDEVTVSSQFGGSLALLARWALHPYDLIVPLGSEPHLHMPWPNIETYAIAQGLDVDALVELVAVQAFTTHALVTEDRFLSKAREMWTAAITGEEVNTELYLTTFERNPESKSWDDQVIILDREAMVRAFMTPLHLERFESYERLTSRVRAAVEVLTESTGEGLGEGRRASQILAAHRASAGDAELYVQIGLATTVWSEPEERLLADGRSAYDNEGLSGLRDWLVA